MFVSIMPNKDKEGSKFVYKYSRLIPEFHRDIPTVQADLECLFLGYWDNIHFITSAGWTIRGMIKIAS